MSSVVFAVAYLGTDGRYGYARENLTAVEVKPLPENIPYNIYSSLMGLLATNGGKLIGGPN